MQFKPGPIAIVGVSALFPGSVDAHGFWRDILAGRDLIGEVPANRWLIGDHYDANPQAADKTYSRRGAFLGDVAFDPVEFGVPPTAVKSTDSSQLLALIVAKQVLEDALNGQFTETVRERCSVILGATSGQELIVEASSRLQRPVWIKALRESGIPEDEVEAICDRIANSYTPWQENTFPGLLGNVIAGRIANRFDLRGSNFVTDAACASSLSALSMACAELQLGHSDLVIAGGVDTYNDITMFVCFSKTPALSPTGDCRPFSDRADGTILGEGLAMFALKRLDDAERDGNRIYAVIRGIGSSSDGRSTSIYAPVAAGQALALRRAYQRAGYGPETVELVEAHGTGTAAGDAAEFESLNAVFRPADDRRQWCALGSIKSQVGHTKAAAGAAGLFKAVMALHQKALPPTLKVGRPNPVLKLEASPFYLNTRARPWVRAEDHPRRASLSSFGFGGTNFHIALEEYTGAAPKPPLRWTATSELCLLGAGSPAELASECRRVAGRAAGQTLAAVALDSQVDFDSRAKMRIAVVATEAGDLAKKLESAARSLASDGVEFPPGIYYSGNLPAGKGKIAFLFPGQGSQYPAMTSGLALAFPDCRAVWDEASELGQYVFPVPAFDEKERSEQRRRLTATEIAQPAIGAASACVLALLRRLNLGADGVAGHSFGEISALYAAGAFDLRTMIAMARKRGEAMSSAGTASGGMLAVLEDAAKLQGWIAEWSIPLCVANRNTPRQNVLSGEIGPLAEAERRLGEMGVKTIRLEVATAFHSPLLAGAVEEFRSFLITQSLNAFDTPFYPNSGGDAVTDAESGRLRDALADQIGAGVDFVETVRAMYRDGFRTFIEVGPGSTLTSFVRNILEGEPHCAIATDRAGEEGLVSLWQALGQIAVLGVPLNWGRLRDGHRVDELAEKGTQKFTMSINGGNYGKPYPPPGGSDALPKPVIRKVEPRQDSRSVPQAAQSAGAADALETYRIFQETIANAHRTWQEHLAKGHADVIRALEGAYLSALSQTVPVNRAVNAIPAPVVVPAPQIPEFRQPTPASPPPPTPVYSAPETPAAAKTSDLGARELLWSVVSEKTGYPVESLESGMALEADLGIDSIKRVEIFSAIQDRLPGAIEFEPSLIAELRTLGEIVRKLESTGRMEAPSPAAPKDRGRELVLALIAEKTGYPVETLQPDMALEADLGIDSIKRVEIFSALQDRRPDVPEDTAGMAALRTIADVISFIDSAGAQTEKQAELPVSAALVVAAAVRKLRFNVVRRDAPAMGHNMLSRHDGPIAVVDSFGEIGASLARQLNELGFEAELCGQVPPGRRAAIFLAGLKNPLTEEEGIAVNREAFLAARAIGPAAGLFVTVQDTGGDFRPENPARAWTGGVAGIARTAALEWPSARVKAVDIDTFRRDPEDVARALVRELSEGGVDIDVALNAWGHRVTLASEPAEATGGRLELEPDAFVISTGGARGVTAACLLALVRLVPLRILITGRTPLDEEPSFCSGAPDEAAVKRAILEDAQASGICPEHAELAAKSAHVLAVREIRSNIEALKREGSIVRYEQVDIRDGARLSEVVASLRGEWGPVRGIVHGAGVLADKRIEGLSPELFDRVFDTKVRGLRALLDSTVGDPLAFLAIFSSVAARRGNPGQSAYAAANEAMNRMAHAENHRRMGTTKVKTINWGPWDGGMVTPALKRMFQERGVTLLGMEEGARFFVNELFVGMSEDVEVIAGDLPERVAPLLRVVMNRETHSFLDSHRIDDVPVFPVVSALDLFLRASRSVRDGGDAVCRNLRVLRGIRLESFENGGDPLIVHRNANGGFEIVSATGTRHYEASFTSKDESDRPRPAAPLSDLRPSPWREDEIYGSLLFHGPAFRVIESVDGISGDAISATVRGTRAMSWADPYRACDAAMLDGGLQLARLWGFHTFGRPSLPAGVGSVRIIQLEDASESVHCEVRVRSQRGSGFVCDIAWSGRSGNLALMENVEMYLLAERN